MKRVLKTTDERGHPVSLVHHDQYAGDLYSVAFVNEHDEARVTHLMGEGDAREMVASLRGERV